MLARRSRTLGTALVVGALALAFLPSCGWQTFPDDRTIDTIPPDPPSNLAATGGDQMVTLTWTPSPSIDVVDYFVYIKVEGGTTFSAPISVGNVAAVQIVGLANGTQYRARVQAVDASGNLSLPENAAEVVFNTVPEAPTDLTLTPLWQNGMLGVFVEWTHTLSQTLDGYFVYASLDGGATWSDPVNVGTDSNTFLTSFVMATNTIAVDYATTYDIAVATYDANGLVSALLSGQVLTPPAPPTQLAGIGGNQQVTLSWVLSTSSTAVGYVVYVSSDSGATFDAGQAVGNVNTVLLTQDASGVLLQNSQTYIFRVRTHDAQGQESLPADAAEIPVQPTDVPQPPPNPVQNLQAIAGNQEIFVNWLPPAPGSGGPVYGYEVSWNDTGSLTDFSNFTFLTPASVITYTITGLSNGTQYTIRVRAFGSSTNIVSSPEYAWATPGAPNIVVRFSDPGGAYRYNGVGDSTLPDLVLSGVEDATNPGTGTIYYTTDGSNPVISAAVKTPTADGVTDSLASRAGTFVQVNTGTGVAIPLDLDVFGAAGADYVQVRAFFDPDGTPAQTSGSGNEGITVAVTYFIFGSATSSCVPVGGLVRARRAHTATRLAGGSVLLGGGRFPDGAVHQNSEMFNKSIEFFSNHAVPTTPRAEHVAVTLDDAIGTVLLIGGRRQIPIGTPVNFASDLARDTGTGQWAVDAYDPTTGIFTGLDPTAWIPAAPAGSMEPRVLHQAVRLTERVSNNRVLVIAGVINPAAQVSGTAVSDSTADAVHVSSVQVAPSQVTVGDILTFTTGPTANESQIVSGVTVSVTTGNTIIYLLNSLSSEPDGGNFQLFRPTYGGCQWVDPLSSSPTYGVTNAPSLPATDNRFGHRAALLQDGRILVTGGYYPPRPILTDIELTVLIFDPTTNAGAGGWSYCGGGSAGFHDNAAKMQTNRYFHTATVLADGKVLVAGGIDDGTGYFAGTTGEGNYRNDNIRATCDLVEVAGRSAAEITTRATGSLKQGRFFHTATLLNDGRVLIAGGVNYLTSAGDVDPTASAELYDPTTGTFSYTGSMLEPRYGHTATLLEDGRVLITGGRADYLPEIFDPATGKFSATAGTMTGNHMYHAASVRLNDGRVLVTGGQRPNQLDRQADRLVAGPMISTAEILDPDTSLFETLATTLSAPRAKHSMTLLDDGRVLIAGGEGGTGTTPTALSSTNIFDPVTEALSAGPDMSARYGHSALALRPARLWTAGTATFDGTGTVTGAGTTWATTAGVQVGDRITLNADSNLAYFEITAVVSDTQLAIRTLDGHGHGVPTGTGTYVIRMERPYTSGNATFTYNSVTVAGTGTQWDIHLSAGDLIRPSSAGDFYTILTVDSPTQVTLDRPWLDRSSPGGAPEAYTAQPPSEVLIVGGGRNGLPLTTGEIFDPKSNAFSACSNTLALGRYQHSATLLANGWVLIVGGNNNYDRTAELFDPASRRFRQVVLPVFGTSVTYAARNNHHAQLMSDGSVLLAGGEVAQTVAELFVPDSDANPNTDADGDGVGGLDLNASSFAPVTPGLMNAGRVSHTMTYIPGATERVVFLGGTAVNALDTLQVLTWAGAASTFATPVTLARSPMQAHTTALLPTSENVLAMRGHTVQVYFSK